MQLTMAEKRDFLERIRELVLCDVIQKEDRDAIFKICLKACNREMARIGEEE